MKLKISKEEIKGFSSPVKKAERTKDWAWWGLFAAIIIMLIVALKKML